MSYHRKSKGVEVVFDRIIHLRVIESGDLAAPVKHHLFNLELVLYLSVIEASVSRKQRFLKFMLRESVAS